MSTSVADKALPWAIEWTQRELGINFYGGEPLLGWPLIRHVVPHWKDEFERAGKSVRFSITTNGSLLKQNVRDFFDMYQIGMLLSLDGPKELHDESRPMVGGAGSWDKINPEELLAWRPNLETAWQLDPSKPWHEDDIDEMLELGFKRINFNLNWLVDWPEKDQLRLMRFGKRVARLVSQGKMMCNWKEKYEKAGIVDAKMEAPCGLGTHMLALTPEGYLYPSQEMAFTAFEEHRAAGTAEHYRVGDLKCDPVLDQVALDRVGGIKTRDMKPPPPYSCDDCVATSISIGGCHCRYIGQIPDDPSYRYDVPAGYCQSMRAFVTGLMQGFWIERDLRPAKFYKPREAPIEFHRKKRDPMTVTEPKRLPAELPESAEMTFGGKHGI